MNGIRPIKPKRVSSQVFEQIRELIYRGVFRPGQQIPPERELAVSMEVSRTSVRNAMRQHILYVQEFFEKRNTVTDSIPLKHLAA